MRSTSLLLPASCALVVAIGALAGCTGGVITYPDGGSPPGDLSTIFTAGLTTFSFDPTSDAGPTNGPLIPPGEYEIELVECPGPPPYGGACLGWLTRNRPVTVSYDSSCPRGSGESVPCALFHFVLCPIPEAPDPPAICTGTSTTGTLTTVPLFPGP